MMKNGDYGYNLAFCEEKLIPVIKKIADKHVDTPFEIEKKGHGNFVTSVDKAIEQELIEQLHDLIPKAGFIAEESGEDSKSELNWVIESDRWHYQFYLRPSICCFGGFNDAGNRGNSSWRCL